ncbi:CFEM domain-containing protein [Purpureocillium lavendulum]|uniref:CFEM domain-containing protein n=1 Tax=Purpureocillium lavendulum TaxID=1247861 RepID=A0AB34FLQ2_9HYPO|nr:CFEM domain-containing protein [Purpureocillium lavendulum]
MVSQNVSRTVDENGLVACLCVACVFVVLRTGARWYKLRTIPFEMEDVFMYAAIASFAITSALYLATIPTFFNVMAITAGEMQPYPSLPDDLVVMLREFFVVQLFFWLTLWAVKWSLLFMFKRLTDGLPLYNRIWWAVLVFSILTFIGCCISNFTSCSSMHAWFKAGECATPRDARAKEISLWFSLGADLATDLLIMAVPIRVLWNLRISFLEKISIGVVFVVGILTMVTAIIRSVSLESSTSAGQVSTTWLMLWAGIEGAVVFIRGRVVASRAQYEGNSNTNPSGYNSHPKSRERASSARSQNDGTFWQLKDSGSDKSLHWQSLGGLFYGHPAVVSWDPSRVDVFVRGSDNNIYHKWQIGGPRSQWYPAKEQFERLGGVLYGDVSAASWGAHRIDLFGLGADNACWHQWWNVHKWGGWESLGGRFIGDIASVSYANHRIDVFGRGMDNHIHHNSWNGIRWSGWESLGGAMIGSPQVVSWGPQRLDVFARGVDNGVHHKSWTGVRWTPSKRGWHNLGGVALDDPKVLTSRPGRLEVFTRGTGNDVLCRRWESSAWKYWINLGGSTSAKPDAVTWDNKYITVAIQGTDNRVHVKEFDGDEWATHWKSLKGAVTNGPVLHPRGGKEPVVFARGTNSALLVLE